MSQEGKPMGRGIDAHEPHIANSIIRADELERVGRALLVQASEIRRAARPVIRLELREDGLITIQGWRGSRMDSCYLPRTLDKVIPELSVLVRELQQPDALSSLGEHVR